MTQNHWGCLTVAVALSIGLNSSDGATVLIDFGGDAADQASSQDSLSRHWNNVFHNNQQPVGGHQLISAETGLADTGLTLTVGNPAGATYTSGFNTAGPNGDGLTSATGALAARNYPASALKDSLYGNTSDWIGNIVPSVQLVLSNVDPSGYDMWFYANRGGVADNRETQYQIIGATTTTLLMNPATANHDQLLASAAGIVPDGNGQITINISPGANNNNQYKFFYLGVMELAAVPEPTSLGLLGAGALGLVHRRRVRR